jgi:SAM-dependent methyltransferase
MKIVQLLRGFVRGKLRGIYKFLLTNSSVARKYLRTHNRAGGSSLYCYGIWMQNLKHWAKLHDRVPMVVVEIGPGDSLGVGLAALISGSQTCFALEKTQFWNLETNIRVFDELVTFFKDRKKTQTIDPKETADSVEEKLDFPSNILTEQHLTECLSDERLKAIRLELLDPENLDNVYIHSIIPWNSADVIENNTVDYIFSHTVLQHLDDLSYGYNTMNKWLKNGGCLAHTIDLRSLNRTKLWNGHWTLSKLEWKLITGGVSLINREPLSTHLKLLKANDFEIKYEKSVLSDNTLSVEDLSKDFKHLDERDLTTSGYYYIAQLKPI